MRRSEGPEGVDSKRRKKGRHSGLRIHEEDVHDPQPPQRNFLLIRNRNLLLRNERKRLLGTEIVLLGPVVGPAVPARLALGRGRIERGVEEIAQVRHDDAGLA